jgi:hypothetical protein
MSTSDSVEMDGVRNAGVVRKMSVNWTVPELYGNIDTLEEVQLQAEQSLRGIHVLASQFWAVNGAVFEKDFTLAVKILHEIAGNPQYASLYGEKVSAGYTYSMRAVLSSLWKTGYKDKWVALKVGRSLFESDDQVRLPASKKRSSRANNPQFPEIDQ